MSLFQTLVTRTPLGWLQLRHNPLRLAVALAGVAFANVLIFMQLGVMGALFETSATPIRIFNADILLLSPEARDIGKLGTLPRRRLFQALGVPGVAAGASLQVGSIEIRNRENQQHASVMVFAVDPDFDGFHDDEIRRQLPALKVADTALMDRLIRGDFASAVTDIAAGTAVRTEMMGRTVTLQGLFSLGASFSSDGTLIMSDQTFLRLFPRNTAGAVSAVLLRVTPGADVEAVARALRDALPGSDTRVMTLEGYAQFIKDYMANNTPIGFVFTFGVIIGLFVGFIIVYQILSADVNDHLAEYATFKAMGYSQGYLLGIVFEEALVLAGLGFIPGIALAFLLYWITSLGTELAMVMPASRPLLVFGLTLVMCCVSGAIATRRLAAADPADVF